MSDADYTNDPEAVIEQAAAHKAEADERHDSMLQSVADGEEWNVEEYEWVELGGVDLKVRTWLEGSLLENFGVLHETIAEQDPGMVNDALDAELELLTAQTEVIESEADTFDMDEDIRQFWKLYVDRWGDKGLDKAAEAILEPLELEEERKRDAIQSFPGPQGGPDNRVGRDRR